MKRTDQTMWPATTPSAGRERQESIALHTLSQEDVIWETTPAPTTTDADSSISFASFCGVKRQDTLLGAFCSITRVKTLQETSFQSWLAERDKRAELSPTCRGKTSSDHVANDNIGRRPMDLCSSILVYSLTLSLSFGRGMQGSDRGHVRGTTALL